MRSLMILIVLSLTGCATTGGGGYGDPAALNAASQIFTNWMSQDQKPRQTRCYTNTWTDAFGKVYTETICR